MNSCARASIAPQSTSVTPAAPIQRRDRADATGQLKIGFRAVHDVHPAAGDLIDIVLVQRGHVYGHQPRSQHAQFFHARQRLQSMLLDAVADLAGGF
jgi:hypothetical protein